MFYLPALAKKAPAAALDKIWFQSSSFPPRMTVTAVLNPPKHAEMPPQLLPHDMDRVFILVNRPLNSVMSTFLTASFRSRGLNKNPGRPMTVPKNNPAKKPPTYSRAVVTRICVDPATNFPTGPKSSYNATVSWTGLDDLNASGSLLKEVDFFFDFLFLATSAATA